MDIKLTSTTKQINMPTVPLKRFMELSHKFRAEREAYTSRVQTLVAERLAGVSVRAETNKAEFSATGPLMMRLILGNPTAGEVFIHGNPSLRHFFARSLKITGPDGKQVETIPDEPIQIGVFPLKAPAQSEKPLFNWEDARASFKITTPGDYRVELDASQLRPGAVLSTEEIEAPSYPSELAAEPLFWWADPGVMHENQAGRDFRIATRGTVFRVVP